MKKDIKKTWVKALKSGAYHKTKGQLRRIGKNRHPKYCCLGVLTQLYCNSIGVKFNDVASNKSLSLSIPVMKWAGIGYRDPVIKPSKGIKLCASSANDTLGLSFKEIAKAKAIDQSL